MRVISVFATLLVLGVGLTAKALAAETNTNETNIKTEIKLVDGREYGEIVYAIPEDSLNYLEVKPLTEEELKREAKLARFKDKLEKAKLPKEPFIINASAYTAAADECGKSDGITASGVKVMENRTIACPPQFPFGAKIKIEGMGTYVCEDRGGAIKGNHFDIYMQTKKEAFSFGRKNLLAEVVK
ncbi:MAG: 3D domain-containing protein [Candidatus Moranbacteria bacterium]|nr:3D domain-containing protein [Candidatus Moranbacteria bacterium]